MSDLANASIPDPRIAELAEYCSENEHDCSGQGEYGTHSGDGDEFVPCGCECHDIAAHERERIAKLWPEGHMVRDTILRSADIALVQLSDLPGEPWKPEDGDTKCQKCHLPNTVWFADSPLWNDVMRDSGHPTPWGIVCLRCFAGLCEERMDRPVLRISVDARTRK